MKKLFALCFLIATISTNSNGQAFSSGTKLLTVGIGGAQTLEFDPNYTAHGHGTYPYYAYPSSYSRLSGLINVQMEFAVHKYVGVGFTAGFGGNAGGSVVGPALFYSSYYNSDPQIVVPIGVIANCHFYQIIADKTGKGNKMHADQLDIYAGLNLGSGFAVDFDNYNYYGGTRVLPIFFAGPQVGARYYFNPNIGVNLEVGYGKTFVNAGITFKMGGSAPVAERHAAARVDPHPTQQDEKPAKGNSVKSNEGNVKPDVSKTKPNPNGSKVIVTPAKK